MARRFGLENPAVPSKPFPRDCDQTPIEKGVARKSFSGFHQCADTAELRHLKIENILIGAIDKAAAKEDSFLPYPEMPLPRHQDALLVPISILFHSKQIKLTSRKWEHSARSWL